MQHSEWAAPIVPVVKTTSSVRICGDYKLTANTATRMEIYPLPRIEDLFASLAGGKVFSRLDLSQAYLQLPLAEDSQPLVTVNTHKKAVSFSLVALWSVISPSPIPAHNGDPAAGPTSGLCIPG